MTRPARPLAAALSCALICALAVGGCSAPGGLGVGEPAPPVSAQPRPESLWPLWTDHSVSGPGKPVGTREPRPQPLKDAPEVGAGGLPAVSVRDVVRADKAMKPFLAKGWIDAPGKVGIRPPVYRDLTGDGAQDLIVAADAETGRTALTVYTAEGTRIVPVLFTVGRRLAVETIGGDLLLRTAADDGSEQAVRYHWDGERMRVVSDERRYSKSLPGCDSEQAGPQPKRTDRYGRVCE
ncbi:hypothetical protein EDE04_4643 [Streptomyces sp. 2132.2]|uniref:hypothetical protein n=1 Tax=Streptomyces sp. 2132.2 TaxID=2485161 RepID=UPI000C4E71FA|nr:hypothetical protein [Streptomyces sp. 2132.2]ROQ98120.1 hypothetical protein EDE04_4643 [Streptomyces sp. 2132.2]